MPRACSYKIFTPSILDSGERINRGLLPGQHLRAAPFWPEELSVASCHARRESTTQTPYVLPDDSCNCSRILTPNWRRRLEGDSKPTVQVVRSVPPGSSGAAELEQPSADQEVPGHQRDPATDGNYKPSVRQPPCESCDDFNSD